MQPEGLGRQGQPRAWSDWTSRISAGCRRGFSGYLYIWNGTGNIPPREWAVWLALHFSHPHVRCLGHILIETFTSVTESLSSLSLTRLWTPPWRRPTISCGDQWIGGKNECINQAPVDSSFTRDVLYASILVFGSLLFNGRINSSAQIRKGRWTWVSGM